MTKLLPSIRDIVSPSSLAPFAATRLIVFDVDGTLTETRRARSHWGRFVSLKRSLEAPRNGVRVTVATGRTMSGTVELLSAMELRPTTPAIFCNGAVVGRLKDGEFLRIKRIDLRAVEHVLDAADRLKPSLLVYFTAAGLDAGLFDGQRERLLGLRGRVGRASAYDVNHMPIEWTTRERLRDLCQRIQPTAIVAEFDGMGRNARNTFLDSVRPTNLTITITTSGWVEMAPRGVDKSDGVRVVAEALGIKSQEVLAIGDGENDAAMLRWAGVGVAVPEAATAALGASDFVTRATTGGGAAVETLLLVRAAKHLGRLPHDG